MALHCMKGHLSPGEELAPRTVAGWESWSQSLSCLHRRQRDPTKVPVQQGVSQRVSFVSVLAISAHHLSQGLEDEDAQLVLLVLQQGGGVGDEASDEATILTFSTSVRSGGEEKFRAIENIDQYRDLSLDQGLEVIFQNRDNVMEVIDHRPVCPWMHGE